MFVAGPEATAVAQAAASRVATGKAKSKLSIMASTVRAARHRRGAILPWRDRAGRFSALKAAVFAAVFIPGLVLAAYWQAGALGGRPIHEMILTCGQWMVRFLLITLAITPLRRIASWPQVLNLRRMLGVTALAYGLAHISLYIVDQNFRIGFVVSEIALRIYLTIGFIALLGLTVLGVTSTDGWMRSLGRSWKRLHRLVYVIGVLGLLHFFMQSKANVSQAVLMAGFFVWLMLWRAIPARWQANVAALLALAVVSAIGTAFLEYAWYATATHVPAIRVLMANLSLRIGPRPAVWVGIVGLAIAAAVGVRQGLARVLQPAT